MIAYLKGIIFEVGENTAVIDVNGVGYLFYASSNTLKDLRIGEAYTILTDMIVREDSQTLYGFIDKKEQSMFRLLTTVQGVGPKVCLGILSSLSADGICKAIASEDTKMMGRANGVGPKLATRIVSELKDKIKSFSEPIVISDASRSSSSDFTDAVSALINFGYQRSEAVFVVDKIISANPKITLSDIIRQALKSMGK